MVTSHHHCWLIINKILSRLFQGYIYLNTQVDNVQAVSEIYTFEITQLYLWRDNELTSIIVFQVRNSA